MPKITRKQLMDFFNTGTSAVPVYVMLGSDLEEFNKEFNMDVEATKNIKGESAINITQGNATASVEPYLADSDDTIYTFLQNLIDTKAELDGLKTDVVRVKGWEPPTVEEYPATKEEVFIEIISAGGDTTGYQIPFNIHYTGITVAGTFNPTTKAFTAS